VQTARIPDGDRVLFVSGCGDEEEREEQHGEVTVTRARAILREVDPRERPRQP
jgi:hypothetical protein